MWLIVVYLCVEKFKVNSTLAVCLCFRHVIVLVRFNEFASLSSLVQNSCNVVCVVCMSLLLQCGCFCEFGFEGVFVLIDWLIAVLWYDWVQHMTHGNNTCLYVKAPNSSQASAPSKMEDSRATQTDQLSHKGRMPCGCHCGLCNQANRMTYHRLVRSPHTQAGTRVNCWHHTVCILGVGGEVGTVGLVCCYRLVGEWSLLGLGLELQLG